MKSTHVCVLCVTFGILYDTIYYLLLYMHMYDLICLLYIVYL